MPENIVFDAGQYDGMIRSLDAPIAKLTELTTGPSVTPLTSRTSLLQPDGQTWQPAVDLCAAGYTFFDDLVSSVTGTSLPRLTELRQGLATVRGTFLNADLAALSTADLFKSAPQLSPAPIRSAS